MASAAATATNMTSKITRWSLNSLARAKKEMTDPQNAGRIFAAPVRDMARDVALRLEAQQTHIDQMEEYVQHNFHHEERPSSTNTSSSSSSNVISTSTFSQPYWWKNPQTNQSTTTNDIHRESARVKAQQNLKDLKYLHQNTQEIARTFWDHLEHKDDDIVLDKREQKWLKATFRQIRDRHALTVENLADFVISTRPYWETPTYLDTTVMDFLCGRSGVQLLCEHALAPGGIICEDCDLKTVLEEAISEAQVLCESNYSHLVTAAPEVVILSQTLDRKDQCTIVRPWVHYVLVELLKNAMAKSMERMIQDENTCNLLPPRMYISIDDHHQCSHDQDKEYLSIDIIDQGGGFSNPELAKNTDVLFDFVRTKDKLWDRLDDQQSYNMVRSPMQGLGVGLCLSRLMMQHFGGTVKLSSHPPFSLHHQEVLGEEVNKMDKGCVASIKLLKDLDHPEHLCAH